MKKPFNPFTFDFDSLYDSISPVLAVTALEECMKMCRPSWDSDFRSWLLKLIEISMEASIGEFNGRLFRAKSGLPTGGSLIVQLANISVFFALNKILYSNQDLMKDIVSIKRYIDDGIAIHTMTNIRGSLVLGREKKFWCHHGRLNVKESDC